MHFDEGLAHGYGAKMRSEEVKAAYVSQQQQRNSTLEQIACRGEELFYRLVAVPLVAYFPAPLAYGLACRRGDWRCRHDKARRRRILSNLEGVFGEQLSPEERLSVARDVFRRQACQAIDATRLAGNGRALARLVEIRGQEHLEAALAAGKGAVICIGHFGSHGSFPSVLGVNGFPITAVDNSKSNFSVSFIQQLLWRLHLVKQKPRPRHLHRPNIEPRMGSVEAAMSMAEVLRANEVIVIAIDVPVAPQDRPHAMPVEYLGRRISLLPGGVSIAEHTGSAVLVAVALRAPNWRQQVLELTPVPLNGDVEAAFQQCVSMVEAPIRQHLALWDGCLDTQAITDLGLLPTT
jgi:KDO2-lipid IV(A) lauroyltransferase